MTAKLIIGSGKEARSALWSDGLQCQYRRELENIARTPLRGTEPMSVLNIAVLRVVERTMISPGAARSSGAQQEKIIFSRQVY